MGHLRVSCGQRLKKITLFDPEFKCVEAENGVLFKKL